MSADDKFLGLAGDIADGRPVDWAAAESAGNTNERATIEQLRTFAGLLADDGTLKYRSGPDDLPAGSTWGPLTIVARVGNGRFGTVYRVRDPRLDRDVALKLLTWLPVEPLPSSSAIAEARLLARVRHPNVLTVHGAESIDGRIGIWSEFIEGRTLEEVVRAEGPMRAAEVAAIGIDLCRALSAVHNAGLLHRDIKAQNVMREIGGRIVLMDFGTGHDPQEIPARPGDLSGTPLYVAPEIFAGGAASVASDIYAVAVVLFFLATGQYPVPGTTVADVTNSHLKGVRRRIQEIKADVPAQLVEAIERGLATDPAQRFSDSQSFELALSDVQRVVDPDRTPERSRALRDWKLITTAVAIGTAAIVATIVWLGTKVSRPVPIIEAQRLTFEGYARLPAISPDGTQIAYNRPWEPGRGIWLRETISRIESQIFAPDSGFDVFGLTFTPDGKELDFVGESASGPPTIWRMSLSGGDKRQLVPHVHSAVGWSPDGRRMAFIRKRDSQTVIVLADPDGSNERVLAKRSDPKYFVNVFMTHQPTNRPSWSPDSRTIAVVTLDLSGTAHSGITLVDVATGREIREISPLDQTNPLRPRILETAWLDDTHLLFDRDTPDLREGYQIWLWDLARNESRQLTREMASFVGIALTADRRAAVSERGTKPSSIWLGNPSDGQMSVIVPTSTANPFLGSVNNRGEIVYSADMEKTSIWFQKQNQSTRLADGDLPVFVPSGDSVVFVKEGEQAGLWRVNTDGSGETQIVRGLATRPRVTPDGAYVLFAADWTGSQSIWSVPTAGGSPRELIHGAGNGAGLGWWLSPNGRQLFAFRGSDVTITCDLPDCASLRELRGDADPAINIHRETQPEAYKGGVAFTDAQDVWFMPPGRGKPRQITHFPDNVVAGAISFSPDGRWLAVARGTKSSDAVLLKNFR